MPAEMKVNLEALAICQMAVSNAPLYSYGLEHLDFLILGDCDIETLYNDFHYGSYRGTLLQNDGNGGPSGRSMGLGVDGSTKSCLLDFRFN